MELGELASARKYIKDDPEIKEDNIEEVEDKYYKTLALLNTELESRARSANCRLGGATGTNANSPTPRSTSMAKLPPIDIPTFNDVFTSRAYQLERGAEDPKMDAFLAFLERRALALENADPGGVPTSSGQHRQQQRGYGAATAERLTAAAATQQPTCILCAPADEDAELRACDPAGRVAEQPDRAAVSEVAEPRACDTA